MKFSKIIKYIIKLYIYNNILNKILKLPRCLNPMNNEQRLKDDFKFKILKFLCGDYILLKDDFKI